MQEIFYSADRLQANPDADKVAGYVDGEVYVGTSSLEDKSDKMSWKEFVKTYIVDDVSDAFRFKRLNCRTSL